MGKIGSKWGLALALALALSGLGCGGNGAGAGHPASDPELVEQAMAKIQRAAAAVLDETPSRYLPGEKRLEVLCLSPEEARRKKVGPEFIQCQVEAFSTPSRKRPESVYVEGEAWRVPVAPDSSISGVAPAAFSAAAFSATASAVSASILLSPTISTLSSSPCP